MINQMRKELLFAFTLMLGSGIALLSLTALSGCDSNSQEQEVSRELTPAEGGRYYGGVFSLSEPDYIKSLFPPSIVDVYSYRVASQIYEGLFKFDQQTLEVIPSLASSYEVDETGTVYTINLRKGVKFHDDSCFPGGEGREVVAEDVAYCLERLCIPSINNQSFYLLDGIVKGAREMYDQAEASSDPASLELEGVEIVDSHKLKVTLERPSSLFMYNLCRPGTFIYPREAYEKYGNEMRDKSVGTGPFTMSSIDEEISIILKRNEEYYMEDEFGNQLPFLDAIHIRFIRDKNVELMTFKRGDLDMMYRLPAEHIIEILEASMNNEDGGYQQFRLEREPEMSTQLLTLNNQSSIFKDVNVRKAFAYAIDRERLLNRVLNGEGYDYGKYGITPPSFPQYDVTQIQGYTYNVDSARYYLAKAGYKNGKGFPTIQLDLNTEAERYTNVAIDIKKQLKDALNVEIELNIGSLAKVSEASMNGDFHMLRHAWIADSPSPNTFLWFFTGDDVPATSGNMSYPNLSRYQDKQYDEYYRKAVTAKTQEEAMEYYMKAEKLVMADCPAIILWYDEGYRLMQSYVENFPNNPMQYRDFSAVYLTPRKEKAQEEDEVTIN